jgi:hypothetical protein
VACIVRNREASMRQPVVPRRTLETPGGTVALSLVSKLSAGSGPSAGNPGPMAGDQGQHPMKTAWAWSSVVALDARVAITVLRDKVVFGVLRYIYEDVAPRDLSQS